MIEEIRQYVIDRSEAYRRGSEDHYDFWNEHIRYVYQEAVGLADEGEIANLYSDWEVLQFKTYVFDDEHPGVPRHQHAVNKLVARKKAF